MAFSLDINIYNWLLVEVLKVNPTGDPVNDAVYLVLLPMVVIYMFVNHVVGSSRFGEAGKIGIKTIISFVIWFIIIRQGFYPIFAGFSLPLLYILMIWYAYSFIIGEKSGGKEDKRGGFRGSGGGSSGTTWGGLILKGANRAVASVNPRKIDEARTTLRRLNGSKRNEDTS